MAKLYPVNVHATSGQMIVSLAFKTAERAANIMREWAQHDDLARPLDFSDDFGHDLKIRADVIGFMIYVDEEKDKELGDYIMRKQAAAAHRAESLNKLAV